VGEEILAAFVRADEAETLGFVKPLDSTRSHLLESLTTYKTPGGAGSCNVQISRLPSSETDTASHLKLNI
jgi:hypothetical protein